MASVVVTTGPSEPRNDHKLSCENLGYAYGFKFIFKNCNLNVYKYEFAAIIGPTGTITRNLMDLARRKYVVEEGIFAA